MAKKKTSAFDLKESQLKGQWKDWNDLGAWLASELDAAISMRGGAADEIRYAWDYYE